MSKEELFELVSSDPVTPGDSIFCGDEISEEVYWKRYYEHVFNFLGEVLTTKEAAELWKLSDDSVVRNSIRSGRFKEDEVRKSGKVWLIKKSAMERVYGARGL